MRIIPVLTAISLLSSCASVTTPATSQTEQSKISQSAQSDEAIAQRQFGNATTRAVENVLIRPNVTYTSAGPVPPDLQVVEIAQPKRTPAVAGTRGIGFRLDDSISKADGSINSAKAIPGPQPEFAGNTFANNPTVNSGSVFIPPDSHAASGPGHIVSVSNTVIQIHTNTATPTQTLNSSLRTFFSALTPVNATFDPKVVYDTYSNRWVVVTLELTATTSRIFCRCF